MALGSRGFCCALAMSFVALGAQAQTVTATHPTTTSPLPDDDFVQVLRVDVNMPAAGTLTSLSAVSLNGSDADAPVVSCYFTGSSTTFSTATAFGDVNSWFATASAPGSPTTTAGSWTNGSNALAQGGGAASTTTIGVSQDFGGFSLGVPTGSRIEEIQVLADAWDPNGSTNATLGAQLSWDNGTTFGPELASTSLTTTDATHTIGGPAALWGHPFTPADLANLKVRIWSRKTGGGTAPNFNLDSVRVVVRYLSSSGGGTVTFSGSQALAAGHNYFFVVYGVSEKASAGAVLDAKIPVNGITIGGATYPAAEQSPTGSLNVGSGSDALFFSDLESGTSTWTTTVEADACTSSPAPGWILVNNEATSPVTSWHWLSQQCLSNLQGQKSNGQWLLDTPSIPVPPSSAGLALTFWHRVDIETNFDGAWLQYSVNGGTYADLPASRIQRNSYTGTTGPTAKDGNHVAWTGTLYGMQWVKVTVDLSGLGIEGKSLKVRFRAEQDNYTAFTGWWIDDVTVRGSATPRLAFTNAAQTISAGGCTAALTVQARDGTGAASAVASSTTVTLTSTGANGSFWLDAACSTSPVPPGVVSIPAGSANSTSFYYRDTTAGISSLTASATGYDPVTQDVTVLPGAATSLLLSGFPNPATAGAAGAFTVTAKDGFGNVATGYTGTVHFTSTDPAAALPANYSFVALDSGTHTFSATLNTAGTRALTATDTVNGALTATQSGIVVNAGALASFVLSGFANPASAGTASTFSVTAKDASNNTVTSFTGAVHFTSSDPAAALPADYSFTAGDNGAHTFGATLKTIGTQSITATLVGGGPTGSQSGIVVVAGAAATLTVSGFANPATGGTASSFTVTARDAAGNVATGYTGTVHLSSSDASATLPADYTFVGGDQGAHAFSGTLRTAGTQSITATDTGNATITGTQSGIVVSGSTVDHVRITATPTSQTVGQSISLALQAVDASNQPVSAPLAITANSTGAAVFSATSLSGASGVGTASVSGSLDASGAGTLTLTDGRAEAVTVSVTGAPNPGTASVTFTPAAADHVRATASTSTAAACGTLDVALAVVDAFDNVVPGAAALAVDLPSDAGATFSATTLSSPTGLGTTQVTGQTSAAGTAQVTVTDGLVESVSVTPSDASLTGTPVAATLSFTAAPADPSMSSFTFDNGDPASLSLGSGGVVAHLVPRTRCSTLTTASQLAVNAPSPLQASAPAIDTTRNDGSYVSTITLASCPASAGTLYVTATVDAQPIVDSTGATVQRGINPVCVPVDPTRSSVAIAGASSATACWSWTQAHAGLPTGVTRTQVQLAIRAVDVNGNPMIGAQVRVPESAPVLRAGTAVDHGDGTYSLPVGSDWCTSGVSVPVQVDGTAIGQVSADFTCAPIDPAASQLTVSNGGVADLSQPLTYSVSALDVCGITGFNRTLAAQIAPASLASVTAPVSTDDGGAASGSVSALAAGTGELQVSVGELALPGAPIRFTSGTGSFGASLSGDQAVAGANATIGFTAVFTPKTAAKLDPALLQVTLDGMDLVAGSVLEGGNALAPSGTHFAAGAIPGSGVGPTTITFQATTKRRTTAEGPYRATVQLLDASGAPASDLGTAVIANDPRFAPAKLGCGCTSVDPLSVLGLLAALGTFAQRRRRAR